MFESRSGSGRMLNILLLQTTPLSIIVEKVYPFIYFDCFPSLFRSYLLAPFSFCPSLCPQQQDREKGEAVVSSTAESEGQSEPAARGSFGRKDSLCRRYCSKQNMDEIHTHFNPLAELNGSVASLPAESPSNIAFNPSGTSTGDSVPAVHRLTSLGR